MSPSTAVHFPLPLSGTFTENGRKLTLAEGFLYLDAADYVIVPAGFTTDFNSVPRVVWNIFAPWEYPEAGVVHDYLYRHPAGRSRAQCDAIHRRIMEIDGASRFLRYAAFAGIRAGGWKPWGQYRKVDA